MKKNILLVSLISIVMLFGACGGSGSKNNEGDNTKKSTSKEKKVTNKDKENAVTLIEYTNNLIDYFNATGDWMRRNNSQIEDMVKMMETERWTNILPFSPNIDLNESNVKRKFGNMANPPKDVMSEEHSMFFAEAMPLYKSSFESLQEDCATLFKYIRNQDYKDDAYASGRELANNIEGNLNVIYDIKDETLYLIDILGDKAERVLLSDHPLRGPIFAMKDDMANMQNLWFAMLDCDEGKCTVEYADSVYKAVAASIEQNKDLFKEELEEHGQQSRYDTFYKDFDDGMGEYRMALRILREGRHLLIDNKTRFRNIYNRIVNDYNRFND